VGLCRGEGWVGGRAAGLAVIAWAAEACGAGAHTEVEGIAANIGQGQAADLGLRAQSWCDCHSRVEQHRAARQTHENPAHLLQSDLRLGP